MNFRLIKISSSPGSLFNLCLAVDLAENDWIRLRSYSDAEVYAGAVVDGAGGVQEWLGNLGADNGFISCDGNEES